MKVLALVVLASVLAAAAPVEKSVDETVRLVEYFLKVPTAELDPKLVPTFLALNPETLPKKLRRKTQAKQIEITALLRVHDAKKAGSLVQPAENCSEKEFVLPLDQAGIYASTGYEEVTEDELKYVMDKTKCTEIDLGCRFSMKIFYKKGKDRRVMFYADDPIMSQVAEARGKGGQGTRFFGIGISCLR